MDPYQFEEYIGGLLEEEGFSIEMTPKSGDFGVDLIAKRENRKVAVQVKYYREGNKVGVQDLNQVLGGRNYYNCDTAMMVTSSSLTNSAWELANNTDRVWIWENINIKKRENKLYLVLDFILTILLGFIVTSWD